MAWTYRAAIGAITLAAIISVGATVYRWSFFNASPEAWEALASQIAATSAPDHLIVYQPPFSAAAKNALGPLKAWPADVLPEQRFRYAPALHYVGPNPPKRSGWTVIQAVTQGPLRYTSLANPHARPLVFSLRDILKRTRVTAWYKPDEATPCTRWDGDRWSCPRDSQWNYVGGNVVLTEHGPEPCTWFHPVHHPGRLELSIPPEVMGPTQRVILRYGFTSYAGRRAAAPVTLRLRTAEQELWKDTLPVELSWRSTDLAWPDNQALHLVATTQNNGASHLCVQLWGYGPELGVGAP